jgi:hypothetical protein
VKRDKRARPNKKINANKEKNKQTKKTKQKTNKQTSKVGLHFHFSGFAIMLAAGWGCARPRRGRKQTNKQTQVNKQKIETSKLGFYFPHSARARPSARKTKQTSKQTNKQINNDKQTSAFHFPYSGASLFL